MTEWKLRLALGLVAGLPMLLATPLRATADEAPVKQGKIVFSKAPINAAKPENLVTTFKSGDAIYGLVQVEKSFRELLNKSDKTAKVVQVPLDMVVDGETVDFQYVNIQKGEVADGKTLVLDIAPEVAKMTAYKDPDIVWNKGKGDRKIGPDTYTFNLSQLKPGKHTIKFQVRSFGDFFSVGEFTIEGESYKFYGELREKILKDPAMAVTLPKAQMTDKTLEASMRKLVEGRGWKNIRKLSIVDKDWWFDRVSGGDSPIKGRHIAAVVAAKDDDGKFYFATITFEQLKTATGWSTLAISNVGDKKPILEANIDK